MKCFKTIRQWVVMKDSGTNAKTSKIGEAGARDALASENEYDLKCFDPEALFSNYKEAHW